MQYVEIARAASERGEVVLRQRRDGDDPDGSGVVELRVNGVFVMDTLETTTERELAAVALRQVDRPRRVLVGGLGLGFTAHEVLADGRVERVDVVEIEEALVEWMRDGTVPHGPAILADERLHLVVTDLRHAVAEVVPRSYDLVLLDVDNGPGYLVHDANSEIYQEPFLRRLAEVVRPDGAAVVWSAAESKPLVSAMSTAFRTATQVAYDVVLQGRSTQYYLYIGRPRPELIHRSGPQEFPRSRTDTPCCRPPPAGDAPKSEGSTLCATHRTPRGGCGPAAPSP